LVFIARILIFSLVGLLSGCSNSPPIYEERTINDLYGSALTLFNRNAYEKAADEFDEVERQYPYSIWAARSQLMSAFASFKAQKFLRAIGTLDVFISLHPASPSIDYAYYLRALSYYGDLFPVQRDPESATLGVLAFEEVIRRFPNSDYALDAQLKRDFLLEHLASQKMCIAKSYLFKKQVIASLRVFAEMVQMYPRSILIPEALYRIVECQVFLGLLDGATKTLKMLQHNLPKDAWTERACNLLKQVSKNHPSFSVK